MKLAKHQDQGCVKGLLEKIQKQHIPFKKAAPGLP
jgi:hypothetical protein